MLSRKILSLLAWTCFIALTACDQDPLHQSRREISSHYSLEHWEDGQTYYLIDTTKPAAPAGGGVLDGTVQKIGWNGEKIIAKRFSIFRGDPDGWMVVDLKSRSVSGPFAYPQALRLAGDRDIPMLEPAEAWEKLK